MRTDKWYQRHLSAYFTEHYAQYEDTARFWPNIGPDQWTFDVPELGRRVRIACDEKGNIIEVREQLW